MEGSGLLPSPLLGVAAASSQLASPPYHDAGPPSLLLQGVPVGPPSLFDRRKQYKEDMLRNQLERQSGRKIDQPTTTAPSSSSSLPTTFPLTPFVATNPSDTSSESSSNHSYNRASSVQPDSSVDLNHYPSSISSSSTDPIASPFNDLLLSPNPYTLPHQFKPLPAVFSNLLQLHNPPPTLFHQPMQAEDDVLSTLTAPFPPAPALFGEEEAQGSSHASSLELEGMLEPDEVLFGMDAEEEQTPTLAATTRPTKIASKVASPLVEKASPIPPPPSTPTSNRPQTSELLGEQTAFISKLWHIVTHSEYSRFLLWARDGKSFVLLKETEDEFVNVVLPRFFRHSRMTSFVRQLNLYSFQRVPVEYLLQIDASSPFSSSRPSHFHPSTPESASTSPIAPLTPVIIERMVIASGFAHPSFQREQPELLKLMHPRVCAKKPPTAPGSVSSRREEDSGTSRTRRNANRGIGSM